MPPNSEFNDIFRELDRFFKGTSESFNRSNYIDFSCSEKQMDDDHIYYTFKTNNLMKEDINVSVTETTLDIGIKKDPDAGFSTVLPYPVLPKKTKVTLKNGILDIVLTIDSKCKKDRVKIND